MDPRAYIDTLTSTTATDRHRLFRWLAGQGEETRLDAYRLQNDMIKQNRSAYDPALRAEFYYSMLAKALASMSWIDTAQSQRGQLSLEQSRMISETRIKRMKAKRKSKSSPKKDIIRIQFYEEITALRAAGLSWREVTAYIQDHHHQSFCHGWVRDCYLKLTAQRQGAGGVEV